MKHRVLFAGIDGSGKSTSLDRLISRMENDYNIVKIVNRDGSLVVRGNRELVFRRFYWTLERLRPISKRYHFYSVFLVLKYLYKSLVISYVEHVKDCDLVMYEIDFLLHPAVYVTYHFPISRYLSSGTRFRVFSKLFRGKGNSTIFYLDVDPDSAMDRIRARGEETHPHENREDLATLREEFLKIIDAGRQAGFEIHAISTDKAQAEVVEEAYRFLVGRITSSGPAAQPGTASTSNSPESTGR